MNNEIVIGGNPSLDNRIDGEIELSKVVDGQGVPIYNATIPYDWRGDHAELITNYANKTYKLKDTAFHGWTPSTTAKIIVSSQTLGTISTNLDKYEYLILFYFKADIKYVSGTTMKATPVKQVACLSNYTIRRPSTIANMQANVWNNNVCPSFYTGAVIMDYYNASGSRTLAYNGSYGIYGSQPSIAPSSSSSATPSFTIKSLQVNARCHNTYFTTASAGNVDEDKTTIVTGCKVYRVRKGSFMYGIFKEAIDYYNEES